MPIELGPLLRIKSMIDEVVKQEPIDRAAAGLTDAYKPDLPRGGTAISEASDIPGEEFRRVFTPLPLVDPPARPEDFAVQSAKLESRPSTGFG